MGKNHNSVGQHNIALNYLSKAIEYSPKQALYRNEIATTYALLGKDDLADNEIKKAIELEPNNLNIIRSEFGIYIRLSQIDTKYLLDAKKALDKALLMAPNDPRLYYNLGLMYARAGQYDKAKEILNKAIDLKPDYEGPQKALKIIEEEK